MALAILELLEFDDANVRFRIDTGTNKYYQLKAGKRVQRRNGNDWLDEVFLITRIATNDANRSLFNSSKEIAIPATRLGAGRAYVQLFSFKTPDRKSPAFSRVITVPVGSGRSYDAPDEYVPLAMSTSMNTLETFRPPRVVSCRTCSEVFSQPASLDQLLAGIVRVASPIVMNLLSGAGGAGGTTAAAPGVAATAAVPGAAAAPAAAAGTGQAPSIINLLTTLLNSIGGAPPAVAGGGSPPAVVSRPHSLVETIAPRNRFFGTQPTAFAEPFVMGIDDMLIGAAIGQVVQVLPQLMASANQKRIDLKKADNKLVTDILSDINRRMMMDRLLEAQRQPSATGQADNSAAINQLLQLLQQAPPAATAQAPTAPTAPTAAAHSLSTVTTDNTILTSKAALEFVHGQPLSWNGGQKVLFARSRDLQLQLQLKTAEAPKSPLPKAIVKIILRDAADQSVQFEKVFKQKNLSANTPVTFSFTRGELAHLPANKLISVLAEMRWLTKSGAKYKALGSSEIVLVNQYFYEGVSLAAGEEKELTDLKRFRAFWNKVWESPALDVVRGGEKKYLWELNVNAKYTVLFSSAEANGLMQTKLLRGKVDPESLSETIEGRMKAGIELSLSEVNKLLPLWEGAAVLDPEKLEALQSADFLKNNSGELIYNLKLKGRAGERGMVWVVPVFQLVYLKLGRIAAITDAGQVSGTMIENVSFPLPVSARVTGLKSQS